MALGELISEERGKITGQRVLDVDVLKIESSFIMSEGRYRGEEGNGLGTYYAVMRQEEGGVMYGEGQGIATTKDGKGIVTWKGQGIGRFTSPRKMSFRGSLFFHAPSEGKLSSFNKVDGVFEYEVDEEGNCSTKVWEWK